MIQWKELGSRVSSTIYYLVLADIITKEASGSGLPMVK